jgi:hypothetical protein
MMPPGGELREMRARKGLNVAALGIISSRVMKKLFLLCVPLLLAGCASEQPVGADGPVPPATVENDTAAAADSGEAPVTPEAAGPVASVSGETLQPKPWSQPAPAKPDPKRPQYPVAKPVSGKPGVVYSPYAPYAGEVDVRGEPAGKTMRCPFTGKPFIVP